MSGGGLSSRDIFYVVDSVSADCSSPGSDDIFLSTPVVSEDPAAVATMIITVQTQLVSSLDYSICVHPGGLDSDASLVEETHTVAVVTNTEPLVVPQRPNVTITIHGSGFSGSDPLNSYMVWLHVHVCCSYEQSSLFG